MFGEHVGDDLFKVVGVTVQAKSGTHSRFVRDPTQHASQLDTFFREHSEECSRFNYLGEWHSHPSFDLHPSGPDLILMSELVEDPSVGVNFAVLLIVRLERREMLFVSATLCQTGERFTAGRVYVEAQRNPVQSSPNRGSNICSLPVVVARSESIYLSEKRWALLTRTAFLRTYDAVVNIRPAPLSEE